ncbi:MAG: hypothetical protein ACLP50_35460 [Solirubrobacteraceae bacterium]
MLTTAARLGGPWHIRSCGQPVVIVEFASALAFVWEFSHRNPRLFFVST